MNFIETLKKYVGLVPSGGAVHIGRAKKFLRPAEWITEKELGHHIHIVGASGFGKTVLISHILRSRIESGHGCLFIDQKGDLETIQQFSKYVAAAGRTDDLKVFSLGAHDKSSSYNLLNNGSATELRDRIMGSLIWSEEFYKNQSAGFLLSLLIGLVWLRDNRSMKLDLSVILECVRSSDAIAEYSTQVPDDLEKVHFHFEEAHALLKSPEGAKSLQGLRVQLSSIVYSDFGDRVKAQPDAIDLFETVRKGKIAFMFLDTRRFGETARSIGRFIIQDLKSVSARIDSEVRASDRKPFTVIIDEFADLADEEFVGFLDRARSSRMGIVVAHQEISDLDRISPQFAARLMGNTATLFAFLQKRPESAELISGIAGTRTAWKETRQTESFAGISIDTGKRSSREVEEFNVHPNVVKSLGVGECVVVRKYPSARATRLTIGLPR
ncbi:MAG: TraM recognition domain-containing protein [Deltaproteobacteria bacterium]|jgi:conjugal transfer pilus assembly protein TraD|nr:TraM recognition domain-containing protein [Deltaproteobacteria bacterium]